MQNKASILIGVFIGILFVGLTFLYLLEPARSLPPFIPGYSPTLLRHHYTHALATAALAFLAFAFVWFQTGKKSTEKKQE